MTSARVFDANFRIGTNGLRQSIKALLSDSMAVTNNADSISISIGRLGDFSALNAFVNNTNVEATAHVDVGDGGGDDEHNEE